MPLAAGTMLGPYEILGALGAGGMGEMYRARDSRLNREVAVKILPSSFSSGPDRLQLRDVTLTPNGKTYAYSYGQCLSDTWSKDCIVPRSQPDAECLA